MFNFCVKKHCGPKTGRFSRDFNYTSSSEQSDHQGAKASQLCALHLEVETNANEILFPLSISMVLIGSS